MQPFIQLKEVSKTYFKKRKPLKEALKHSSMDLRGGEIFSLLGVNGAGKTTLSTLLAGLHPPTHGDILWDGKSIYEQIIPYRKIVGYCPQKPNIDKALTIEENLLFAGRCYGLSGSEAEKKKDELMEKLELGSYADATADHLSGGYKQRFLLARSMMHDPKLIILDEPTVGLDAHIRKQLWEVIKELREGGMTVLLTTHYLDEAEYLSDRVCFIDKGEIKLIDVPEKLNETYGKKNLEDVFLQLLEDSKEGDT